MFLHILLKKQIQNVALLMPVLIFNMMLIGKLLCLLCRLNLVKINIGILFHSIHHGNACKRLG